MRPVALQLQKANGNSSILYKLTDVTEMDKNSFQDELNDAYQEIARTTSEDSTPFTDQFYRKMQQICYFNWTTQPRGGQVGV